MPDDFTRQWGGNSGANQLNEANAAPIKFNLRKVNLKPMRHPPF